MDTSDAWSERLGGDGQNPVTRGSPGQDDPGESSCHRRAERSILSLGADKNLQVVILQRVPVGIYNIRLTAFDVNAEAPGRRRCR